MDKFIDRRKASNQDTAINVSKWIERLTPDIFKRLGQTYYSMTSDKISLTVKSKLAALEPTFTYNYKDGVYYLFTYENNLFRVNDIIDRDPPDYFSQDRLGETEYLDCEFTSDELIDLLAGEAVLPNFVEKQKKKTDIRWHRGGFNKEGTPSQLSIKKSFKESIVRRNAIQARIDDEIAALEKELDEATDEDKIAALEIKINDLIMTQQQIPMIEKHDLRYRSYYKEEIKSTPAVLFFIMDVSGSMDEERKHLGKVGCYVLSKVLKKFYPNLEIRYIAHTTEAFDWTEEKFFYTTLNGGTVLSSGLALCNKIIEKEYSPEVYNIYIMQLSDGENDHTDDNKYFNMVLETAKIAQLYSYISLQQIVYQKIRDTLIAMKGSTGKCLLTSTSIDKVADWKAYFKEVFSK
jgi:uncharacterized sporulation protein YeaH/YhbH (DUF444 family)